MQLPATAVVYNIHVCPCQSVYPTTNFRFSSYPFPIIMSVIRPRSSCE